jgi:hypothetical protein
VVVLALVASGFLLGAGPAAGAFQSLTVQPGRYTGTNLYVPGETIVITIAATSTSDVFDIEIFYFQPPFGTRTTYASFDNETIPTSLQRTVTWTVPASVPDGVWYWVAVYGPMWFETGNAAPCGAFGCDLYLFQIRGYNFSAWLSRTRYIPGDTVTVGWAATLVRDGSPAPDGVGEIQAYNGPTSLLPSPYGFNASLGSFSFPLSTSADPNRDPFVIVWFNDTAGYRHHNVVRFFDIGFLDALLDVGPSPYAPGAVVTIDVWAKAAPSAGGGSLANPGVDGAVVNLTISDVVTGNPTSYGASGLRTAADGRVTHVFQLAPSPTSATYDVQATVTAHGALTSSESDTFDVASSPRLSVGLTLDRSQYVSGERATATATVDPPGNVTYQWTVTDASGAIVASAAGTSDRLSYDIPANYTGSLVWRVTVNDGQGTTATQTATVGVAFGYLALSLVPYEYRPGDSITASYSLRSQVMSNPTYFYEVWADGTDLVASGNTSGAAFAFSTSASGAVSSYLFVVVASDGGRSVQGTATAVQMARIVLTIGVDRASYLPGETIRISYALTAQGPVALPQSFFFGASLFGAAATTAATNQATGEILLPIPGGTNEGDLLLIVQEAFTGASAAETVHIGSTNSLWTTDVAGIPLFAVLLALILAILVVAVILLWRRVAMGAGPRPVVEKPTPPPPPPGPERRPPTSPMSVACKNCGTTIDITTSRRPIEVMCPSCGETQLVS